MERIGERIQRLMKECDYTQKELANMVGVTEAAMSRYISNERMPKAEILANMATALRTTSDYLLSGKEPEQDYSELYRLVARSSKNMTDEEKMKMIRLLSNGH